MAANSPVVINMAAKGSDWAIKLRDKGWKALSKRQKAEARAHGIGAAPASPIVPRVVRVVNGNPNNRARKPSEPGNAMKSMTITKQEFLGELYAGGPIRTYKLDPRSVATFPQVSVHAQGFNKYRFTSFRVRYSPKVAESECGVCLAYTSDASDPAPKGKYDLYSMSTKFETAAHKALLADLPVPKTTRYLRDSPGENSKDVDAGAMYLQLDGKHDGRLGELFIEFTIVLSEPTYSQCYTQMIVGTEHRSGPNFASIVKSSNTYTITFVAAGSFLLSSYTSKLEKVGQLGMKKASQHEVTNETRSTNIIEVRSEEPGASVVLYFEKMDSMVLNAYISRL